jgi:hypothetical protein
MKSIDEKQYQPKENLKWFNRPSLRIGFFIVASLVIFVWWEVAPRWGTLSQWQAMYIKQGQTIQEVTSYLGEPDRIDGRPFMDLQYTYFYRITMLDKTEGTLAITFRNVIVETVVQSPDRLK